MSGSITECSRSTVVKNTAEMADELFGLGLSKVAVGKVGSLALAPATRPAALQHVVAWVVLNSVVLGSARLSMLPRSVSQFRKEVPPVGRFKGNQEGMPSRLSHSPSDADSSRIAVLTPLTRWLQPTGFLLNANRSERSSFVPSQALTVTRQARSLVEALNTFLARLVDHRRP